MAVAYREIARVLDGARRREVGVVLATALGWAVTAALLLLLAGAATLAWHPELQAARATVLALSFAVGVTAVAWAGLALRRRAASPESVARAIGDREPALRSDLVSAVELERDRGEIAASRRFSLELVEEHVARTAARASALDLARLVPSLPARRALSAVAVAALSTALALAIGGRALVAGYERLLGPEPARAAPRAAPITGDVELTLRYPAYMARPERTLSGTGGEVHAPKGTEVLLRTRADRDVKEAQLVLDVGRGDAARPERSGRGASAKPDGERVIPLAVSGARDLEGRFLVEGGGSYRFRFTRGKKVLAEGPPAAIVVEPDAFPEVRITAPQGEVEVQPGGRVDVAWTASDDFGLGELTLVVKRDGGAEERTRLRDLAGARRDAGTHALDAGALRLAEGDRILYWLEVLDDDAVSGPKRGASATHVLKVYSLAEHRRLAIEKARELWEALVANLGERLELFEPGRRAWSVQRLAQAQATDGRTRELHGRLSAGAVALRRDRSAPPELAAALANVAAGVAAAERPVSEARETLARTWALGRQERGETPLVRRLDQLDGRLDAELEKDALYLERLLDQERADDLVRMARELAAKRRELAALAEKVRDAPTEEGKRQLLAEVQAMKRRLAELSRRMAELAKGMSDEHMNAEAFAELERSKDAAGGLDAVEEALAKGDLDAALRSLDELGNRLQELVAGMERTARRPGEESRELARELGGLKKDLDALEREQRALAEQTEKEKVAYQREVARRTKDAADRAQKLGKLAEEARRRVEEAKPGVTLRSEAEFEAARDRLSDLERALAMKDLDAALESARRALPPVQRLAAALDEDASLGDRYPQLRRQAPPALRAARDAAEKAVPPARTVKEELEKLFPDPRGVLPKDAQARLEEQARRQEELARKAGAVRERMAGLGEKAPIFPPEAGEAMQQAQGEMQGAAGELGQRNPQRGHGRQRQALDALGRFRAGMEAMARRQQGQQGQGEGMPMPFAMAPGGREDGDGLDPSQEKVEIPGEEAYKAPEAFRKDLMEAMKQGAPETYKGEVSRYYQEIVR